MIRILLQRRSAMTNLKMIPSVEENFFKDRCFADQRVAGVNPFQLWKVTKEKGKDSWVKYILQALWLFPNYYLNPQNREYPMSNNSFISFDRFFFSIRTVLGINTILSSWLRVFNVIVLLDLEDTGVSWKSFMEEKLNKEYDWHGAFSEALGASDKDALEKVTSGLDYPHSSLSLSLSVSYKLCD